jgi:hypothetical protein
VTQQLYGLSVPEQEASAVDPDKRFPCRRMQDPALAHATLLGLSEASPQGLLQKQYRLGTSVLCRHKVK